MIDWQPDELDYSLESIQSQMFSPPIGSFCQSDPKHGFCVEEWLYLIWAQLFAAVSTPPPPPPVDSTTHPSIVSFVLPCQSIRNVCRRKDWPDLRDASVSQLTPLLPLNGNMERCCCCGRASSRQCWCGRSRLWATKHIGTAERWTCQVRTTTCLREKKRPKTRFKSKICKLIILLSWWLL